MITERINIDVRPGGVPVVIHVTQYEAGLRQFIFTPYASDGELTIVAGSATLEGTKPDGHAFQQACSMTNSIVTYVLQEQLCAVEGRVWSRLVIRDENGGMIGYTAIVWVVGCAGVKDGAIMSDSDISALQQFLDQFGDINVYRDALNNAVAEIHTETANRIAADATMSARMDQFTQLPDGSLSTAADAELVDIRVMVDGKTAATAGDAVRTQVGNLTSVVNAQTNAIERIGGNLVPVVLELGSINTNTGAYQNSTDGTRLRTTQLIPCIPGRRYHFYGTNGLTANIGAHVIFYTDAKVMISATLHGALAPGEWSFDQTAPNDAAFVAVRINGSGMTPLNVTLGIQSVASAIIDKGNIINAGLDLNTGAFINPGRWALVNMDYAPANYPSSVGGSIVAFASTTSSSFATCQIVTDLNNVMYYRTSSTNGVWGSWTEVAGLSAVKDNSVYNFGNISTEGLDLNKGDFITPGMWVANASRYVPKNAPTAQPCRIISFASSSSNTVCTYQVVLDFKGQRFWRYSYNTSVWTNWEHDKPLHETLSFVPAFTAPQALVNSETITRDTDSTGKVGRLYAQYDAVTAPGVTVTKTVLGRDATDTFDIYTYKVGLTDNTTEKPIVLIIVGEHGDELNSAMVGLYAYKEVVTGALQKYLPFVDFVFIPLMNPWGYENNSRNNSNDVNLNRDFPAEWAYSTVQHNKTDNYSLSQPETVLIYNYILSIKDKILFFCNKHDTNYIGAKIAENFDGIVGYVSSQMRSDVVVNNGLSAYESDQLKTTDGWILTDYTGSADVRAMRLLSSLSIATPGSMDVWMNSIGIHGSLLEVAMSAGVTEYGDRHYEDLARAGLDFLVNWIAWSIEKNAQMLNDDRLMNYIRYYTRVQNGSSWDVVEEYWNGVTLQQA